MTRVCKVCQSPNKTKYELMYTEEDKDIRQIWRYAMSVGDTNVSYQSLSRHMKNHLMKELAYQRGKESGRNEVLSKVLQQDIEIAKEIRDHLQIIHKQIEKYKDRDDLEPEEVKILQDWINQARLTIEQLLKHEERLMPPKSNLEGISNKLLKLVEDFPPEYLAKFTERLGELLKDMRNE